MQNDDLDLMAALTGLLKSVQELDKLKKTPLNEWPTFAAILGTVSGFILLHENHYSDYCERIIKIGILYVIASQGRQKAKKIMT